jgi:hypothetical protein
MEKHLTTNQKIESSTLSKHKQFMWNNNFQKGGVTQLAECLLCKQEVVGSNPIASIFF